MGNPGWTIDAIQSRDGELDSDRSFAALVVHLVSAITHSTAAEIIAETRSEARVSRARQISMYLAHTGLNWTQAYTGRVFGRDRSTVAHACKQVETMREDGLFDRRIGRLERWLRALPLEGSLL